jgi:hypothetical protein
MNVMLHLRAAAFAGVLVAGTAGFAQESQPAQQYQPGQFPGPLRDPTYRRHFGFYIRPDLGFGYMASNLATQTYSGFAGLAGVAIGGAIEENSILAVHIIDSVVQNPNLSSGGSLSDSTMVLWGIGPQYTRYFMPTNMYVSATAALTRVSLDRFGTTGATNLGFGTRLALGKEWWVGDHWGLGAVGHLSYSANVDGSYTMTTYAVGIAFSATYN